MKLNEVRDKLGLNGRKLVWFCLFLFGLALVRIANIHYAESMSREIARTQKEVDKLRSKHTEALSEIMYGSMQSEVSKKVKKLGLKELTKPPRKVEVED